MKKRQRRTFTPEFKLEAACLVLDKGYSYTEACRSLDVGESALRRWVEQLKTERDGVIPPFLKGVSSRTYAAISGGLPPLALCGRL